MSRTSVKHFWLVKTEPETFSLEDLYRSPKRTTQWDGVRNYQARNFLRDSLKLGDGVLIYHSCAKPLAVVGTAEVVSPSYPDPSQFDPESAYFDPKATRQAPIWWSVDLCWRQTFARPVLRSQLQHHKACAQMMLLQKGSRLSVQPVPQEAWGLILQLGGG